MLFHEPFDFHARGRGDACFSLFEGRTLSYRAAHDRSRALAVALLRAGVQRGDRVALLKRNAPDYLLLLLAVSRIGAVAVPLNYRLAPGEWSELLRDSETVMIIADADLGSIWSDHLAAAHSEIGVGKFLLDEQLPGWSELPAENDDAQALAEARSPEAGDTMIQMYTSGTTGKAKGALLTHASLFQSIAQNCFVTSYRLNSDERMLVVLPLFHIAALATVFGAIATGGCLVIHREVDPAAIAKSLLDDDIMVCCLVPAVIQFLLEGVPGIEVMNFPSLKYLAYGASPIAEPVLRKALGVFKCHVAQGYGMTEMGGAATMMTEVDHVRALRDRPDLLLSAGKAVPGTDIRIVDAEGRDLPTGEVGEVLLRSNQLMVGYWKMPEATREALAGGWLHTGDAGLLDADGYLFLRDRLKDMISSGAENVYPAEIERVLFQHPAIADVSVIGIPDPRWGEAVMAVIVCKGDVRPTPLELENFCRQYLGGFKVPKHYSFVDALPRNASGKVLKRALRDRYWEGQQRAIG